MSTFQEKSGNWAYRFNYKHDTFYKGGFARRVEAEDAELAEKNKLRQPPAPVAVVVAAPAPKPSADPMVNDACDTYYQEYAKFQRGGRNFLSYQKVLIEMFGPLHLSEIEIKHILELRARVAKDGASLWTINHYHIALLGVVTWYRKAKGYTGPNAASLVERPLPPAKDVRVLYEAEKPMIREEVMKVDGLFPYYYAGLQTGARLAELCNLRVKDITVPLRDVFIYDGKGAKSRHIPVTQKFIDYVQTLPAWSSGNPNARLLGEWGPDWLGHTFSQAADAAGLPDVTFHVLRHTYATHLLNEGVHTKVVSLLLGHSDEKVTQRHYIKVLNKTFHAAVDHLDTIMGRPQLQQNYSEADFLRAEKVLESL